MSDGAYLIHGTIVTLGADWYPVALEGLPVRQARAIGSQGGDTGCMLRNERSDWVAFQVEREPGGKVDVYTVAPTGRDMNYCATIAPDGTKTH